MVLSCCCFVVAVVVVIVLLPLVFFSLLLVFLGPLGLLLGPLGASWDPNTAPGAPKNGRKGAQEDQNIEPKPQDDKRTEPRRSQDRLRSPKGSKHVRLPYPQGSILEAKTAPKRNRKRSKIEAKIQEAKKTIQDDLGPVLERSWVILGHHLE